MHQVFRSRRSSGLLSSTLSRVVRVTLFSVIALGLIGGAPFQVERHSHAGAQTFAHPIELADGHDFPDTSHEHDGEAAYLHAHSGAGFFASAAIGAEWPVLAAVRQSMPAVRQESIGRRVLGVIDTPLRPPRSFAT
jgi:hypothetical protein